jgi:hypothetical protein
MEVDAWLAPFRRFWSVHVDALERHLDRMQKVPRQEKKLGAAGWHICFDVLEQLLAGEPIGRIVGGEAMQFDWQRLVTEYAKQFGKAI